MIPQVEGSGFRYQQLHIEANSLQRKFEMKQFSNLVVDLSNLNYFGSELIGVLIRLARTATNGSGLAAMCGPSPKMLEVLDGMRLRKLWPIFASRDEAIEAREAVALFRPLHKEPSDVPNSDRRCGFHDNRLDDRRRQDSECRG